MLIGYRVIPVSITTHSFFPRTFFQSKHIFRFFSLYKSANIIWINKRKTKTVQREEDILGIIREYDYHEEQRGTADLVVHYAFRLGRVGKPKIVEMDDASEDENNEG